MRITPDASLSDVAGLLGSNPDQASAAALLEELCSYSWYRGKDIREVPESVIETAIRKSKSRVR